MHMLTSLDLAKKDIAKEMELTFSMGNFGESRGTQLNTATEELVGRCGAGIVATIPLGPCWCTRKCLALTA
jgi:hypothetical protein